MINTRTLVIAIALALVVGVARGARADLADTEAIKVVRVFGPDVLGIETAEGPMRFRSLGLLAVQRGDGAIFRQSLADVREWIAEGPVRLAGTPVEKGEEIRGRLRLVDGSLLAERILRSGYALVDPAGLSEIDRELLYRAQKNGRTNERGLWGQKVIEATKAPDRTGRFVTVCAETTGATQSPDGSWLLYLGGSYPRRDVGVRIPAAAQARFPRPDRAYLHKQICVLGRLRSTSIAPEIVAIDPNQVTVESRRH